MNAVLIVLDGLGDRRCKALNGLTPLQAARAKLFDRLAAEGETGLVDVVSPGVPNGSDTGHLALLGYDPYRYYTGRGPFEALGAGFELEENDVAFRCNFGTVSQNNVLIDRRAGRISTEEGRQLAGEIGKTTIDDVEIFFKHTVEHRGVVVMRGDGLSHKVSNVDPHQNGVSVQMPRPLDESKEARFTAEVLAKFLAWSKDVLSSHPVNLARLKKGLQPANFLLTRGAGVLPKIPSFKEKYGLNAAVVAGGALYKGVCRAAGFNVVEVEAATGTVNTNLVGKVEATLEALKTHEFVLLHIKATDTVSHDRKPLEKAKMIEKIAGALEALVDRMPSNTYLSVTGDHTTPSEIGDHRGDPVPLLVWGPEVRGDMVNMFDEISCSQGGLGRIRGVDLMPIIANYLGVLEMFGE
ncbi:MAG: 2,3-bisphosphoglycerate-independent phosphoglycerate mutase [Candidatus Caldarchaeum sp.]